MTNKKLTKGQYIKLREITDEARDELGEVVKNHLTAKLENQMPVLTNQEYKKAQRFILNYFYNPEI